MRAQLFDGLLDDVPRAPLATLPTPLERGPELPGGARLWVKRDDLTGLGAGGNKVRKLEFLCGDALHRGARTLVTVGAAQSNHCRATAAAGSVLGLDVHLVLAGDRPERPEGNQLLSDLFGAQFHFTGAPSHHWGELEIAREEITAGLVDAGAVPYTIPMGGSTPLGALGYALAFAELVEQCEDLGVHPDAVVFTSSSGGTHAGLVAGRALLRAQGRGQPAELPDLLGIGVARGVIADQQFVAELAVTALELAGCTPDQAAAMIRPGDIDVDGGWLGDDYGTPTRAGDEAIRWAARHGGWVLDRTYTGKGLSGLLGNAARWGAGDDVVFVHTGGMPAVFASGGFPS